MEGEIGQIVWRMYFPPSTLLKISDRRFHLKYRFISIPNDLRNIFGGTDEAVKDANKHGISAEIQIQA
jgi:hypothetical protein